MRMPAVLFSIFFPLLLFSMDSKVAEEQAKERCYLALMPPEIQDKIFSYVAIDCKKFIGALHKEYENLLRPLPDVHQSYIKNKPVVRLIKKKLVVGKYEDELPTTSSSIKFSLLYAIPGLSLSKKIQQKFLRTKSVLNWPCSHVTSPSYTNLFYIRSQYRKKKWPLSIKACVMHCVLGYSSQEKKKNVQLSSEEIPTLQEKINVGCKIRNIAISDGSNPLIAIATEQHVIVYNVFRKKVISEKKYGQLDKPYRMFMPPILHMNFGKKDKVFGVLCADMGVKNIPPHACAHTMADYFKKKGVCAYWDEQVQQAWEDEWEAICSKNDRALP